MSSTSFDDIAKKTSFASSALGLLIAIISGATIGYGFYYTTKFTQQEQSKLIFELKTDVSKINEKINGHSVSSTITNSEVNFLKERLNSLENTVNKVDDKVDKMDDKMDRILQQTKK